MNMEAVKSRYYLPLEKGVALHLNKLESPSPMVAKCKVWLKLDQGSGVVNVFSLLSPLENGCGPSFY